MLKSTKKFTAFMFILIFIICLNSCGSSKISFSPASGEYEITLDEKKWELLYDDNSFYELVLFHENPNVALWVDYYPKEYMMDISAPDLDSFIKFYKTLSAAAGMYENESNSVQELINAEKKDIKGGSAISGKRQKISLSEYNSITEFIYLETDGYYFALYYNASNNNFSEVQSVVNGAIQNLKVLR